MAPHNDTPSLRWLNGYAHNITPVPTNPAGCTITKFHTMSRLNRLELGTAALLVVLLCMLLLCARRRPQAPTPRGITMGRMYQLARLCSKYKTLMGAWPPNSRTLAGVMLITNRSALEDGWGNAFVLSTSLGTLFITSNGADGKPGGVNPDDGDVTWVLDKPIN